MDAAEDEVDEEEAFCSCLGGAAARRVFCVSRLARVGSWRKLGNPRGIFVGAGAGEL
jgi:hypothetical protein